jgi:pimeloyl-ACP methyl ester carboxylesterase
VAAASAIQIGVLGDFSVRRNGTEAPMPPSRKTRALLAYLAVEHRPQRRERLCELFWGIPDDPRGALRWSLSKLRQILTIDGQCLLEADRNVVVLVPGAVELDYDLVRAVSPESVSDLPTERLEAMAAAFRGEFLADMSLSRCPDFESWRVFHANETEVLRLRVLRTLVGRHREDPERALRHLHSLRSLLPDQDLSAELSALGARARATVTAPLTDGGEPVDAPAAEVGMHDLDKPATAGRRQTVHFCRAPDGVRIAYAMHGSGPAIVRTAHWMSHLELERESPVWGYWMDALTEGFSLVRYDERLNGLSDHTADDVSFDAFVADLEAVTDAAAQDRFLLLGISQGCSVAVEYAVRHPERVAGLILYGGFVRGWRLRGDSSEVARREAMGVLIREGWGRDDPTFRQLFTSLFIPTANQAQMDWFNELQRRTVTPKNAWRLSEAFSRIDVTERLAQVTVPTLVLHARGDRLTPVSSGLEFAERIPGARFVGLDSDNHILLLGEPAFRRFFDETRGFAREVLRTPTSIDSRQRREATLLCADFLSPITSFSHLDPEVALEVIDPLVVQAADLVHEHGGEIVQLSDTRLTASFGAQRELEAHALAACRSALELKEAVRRDGKGLARVRIAMDSGPVIIAPPRIGGAAEVEVRGAPLSLVHALNQALRRDLVAATARIEAAAGDAVEMKPLPSGMVTGFSRRERLLEVVGLKSGDA